MFRAFWLPRITWWFYRLWSSTWRKELHIASETQKALDNKEPLVFVFWHGDELALVHTTRQFKYVIMASLSSDGSIMDYVVRKFGGVTSRGSSSRAGSSALRGMVRAMIKDKRLGGIAVDGPRGPIYQVKPGVFEVSRLANAKIVPIGVCVNKPYVFEKSWNKAILPRLFSRVVMYFADPMPALSKDSNPKDFKLAKKLKEMLFDARQHASYLFAPD